MIPARLLRRLALLCATAVACGPSPRPAGPGGGGGEVKEALRGLPPRRDPPLALDDDDDLRRARHLFSAMDVGDAGRAEARRALWAEYERRIGLAFDAQQREEAYQLFAAAIELWDPAELAERQRTPPDLELTVSVAERLYRAFSRFGGDVQTTTALAVLVSAQPDRAAEHQKRWLEIQKYLDDLAVADKGEGAQRSRPIEVLEEVTAHFPSPWACETLGALYADREDALHTAILHGGANIGILRAHGQGAAHPVWNVIRAYARMDRLADAVPLVERMAGHSFDDPDLRRKLRAVLDPDAPGRAFDELSKSFLGQDPRHREAVDLQAARRICLEGARRAPRAPEPLRCLGIIAAVEENLPGAIRWMERALEVQPDDRDVASLLARLYEAQLQDFVYGERLDAARGALKKLEAFHAESARRWPRNPLEPGLEAAYLAMGRGLYNLGEIDEAYRTLKRSNEIKASPDALEQLALIELKRGRYLDAAQHFAAAAAMPRETPIEEKVERARLRRLAGDAYRGAGETERARRVWSEALEEWDVLLDAALSPRQRADVYVERGRLLWALGRPQEAVQSFDTAVDIVSESQVQSAVYSDVISFLTPRGGYAPALDAYHRSLARPTGTEYFKIYTSLWIVYLARIEGREPDPLAYEYLATRKGTRWYHDLARFATGAMIWDELYARADTRGKRAEAFFYHGLALYASGDRDGGDRMMRLTLDTDMFGFFEFDMARYFLDHGPPGRRGAR